MHFRRQNGAGGMKSSRNYRGAIFLYVWYNIHPRATQVQPAAHVRGGLTMDFMLHTGNVQSMAVASTFLFECGFEYMGSRMKCVPDICYIRGRVEKLVKLHISENFVAYRVPANFSIYAKNHFSLYSHLFFDRSTKGVFIRKSYLFKVCFRDQS